MGAAVPRLAQALPHFLVFGPYDAANRTGPAIWLRCVLAGKIPEISLPSGDVPILYLPGVSRATLAGDRRLPARTEAAGRTSIPGRLLVAVQRQGLDRHRVPPDESRRSAAEDRQGQRHDATSIRRAIEKLVDVPVAELQAKSASGELNSSYFDSLVSDDPVDDLLSWLADPEGTRDRWEPGRWETLCSRCIADYGFDPARDGELVGAEKLGLQAEAGLEDRLETVRHRARSVSRGCWNSCGRPSRRPSRATCSRSPRVESWPQDNEAAGSRRCARRSLERCR